MHRTRNSSARPRRMLAVLAAMFAALFFFSTLPASADQNDGLPEEYGYTCCTYAPADANDVPNDGTMGVAGAYTAGSHTITKYYVYATTDANGNYKTLELKRTTRFEWKRINADGSQFIRVATVSGVARLDGNACYCIVAHNANGQARLFPYGSGASNNVYQKSKDASWISGDEQWLHTHYMLPFPWQNSDTRWLRDTSKWTLKLPAGYKFRSCGCAGEPKSLEGKTIQTFTTTMSYLR